MYGKAPNLNPRKRCVPCNKGLGNAGQSPEDSPWSLAFRYYIRFWKESFRLRFAVEKINKLLLKRAEILRILNSVPYTKLVKNHSMHTIPNLNKNVPLKKKSSKIPLYQMADSIGTDPDFLF